MSWKNPIKPKESEFDLDAALSESIGGSNGNGHKNGKVQSTVKSKGFDLDAALDQSLNPAPIKKKDGGSELNSEVPLPSSNVPKSADEKRYDELWDKDMVTTGLNGSEIDEYARLSKKLGRKNTNLYDENNKLKLQQHEVSRGTSIFDNPTLNPSLQKNVVTTADGGEIPITRATPLGIENLQDLQDRVIKKTATSDDIEALANASGKSAQAIQTHILQGTKAGSLIENNDEVQKKRDGIADFIGKYNAAYGAKYDPNEVLSSSQKLNDFLNIANKSSLQSAKETDITQPLTEKQLQRGALNFGMTPITSEMMNQIVQKTIDEDKTAGIPKEKTILKIAEKINPTDFKKVQQAQQPETSNLPATSIVNKIGNLFRDNKAQDELLNYQKGTAELKYNDALKQNALNKMSLGYINGDQKLMDAGQQDLSEVDDNVIDKYPILQKQEIVRRVNETIARESGVVEGSDTEPGRRLERALGADMFDRLRVMRDLGYLDNPKTKDAAMSLLASPQLFADNSLLGNAASSFAEPFKNLGMSVADITGLRNNKDIITDHFKDELFAKDFSGNNPDDPDVPHLKGDVRITRNIINTTANLAGMLAIATVTEGLGTSAGLTAAAAKQLGAYISFGLPSFDPSLKDSKNFLDSEPAQYLYAAINSIANAEGGRLLDLGKITRIPGVSDVFAKASKEMTDKKVTEAAIRGTLDKGKNAYVDFAVKYGKNVTKGAATMAYFGIANNIIKMGFGDPNTTERSLVTQAGTAFLDGVLGMSIMGGFGAAADMRNEKNTSFKGTIYNMAVNHDAAKDVLDLGLKNGLYTKGEYDQKVQILNTSIAAKNALDVTEQQTGIELSQDQKAVYVANKTAQGVLKKQAEQPGITEETANKYLFQVEKLAEQSEQILSGQLKFTSTLEPMYDLYNAEKEYNEAKENFNPTDKKSDDALLAAKDKYDKLYSDYLSDKPDLYFEPDKDHTFYVTSISDIPEQYRDRATKIGETKTRKALFGVIPYGKEEAVSNYRYTLTGKEANELVSSQSKINKDGKSEKSTEENAKETDAQSTEENGQQVGVLKDKGAEVETAPFEELKKVKLEGVDQKYKKVEFLDPVTGESFKDPKNKDDLPSARVLRDNLIKRHDILTKLVNCL